MKAPERLVNKGQSLRFGTEEQRIVVAADFAIKGRNSFRSEVRCATGVKRGLFVFC